VRIDSESESEDVLSNASVDMIGTELNNGGRSEFPFVSDSDAMPRGKGGTGGVDWEVSIGGGGGAKGGNFIEIGTLRTCRKMAEADAGQMARKFIWLSSHRQRWKMK
jgi:hypothetical protein